LYDARSTYLLARLYILCQKSFGDFLIPRPRILASPPPLPLPNKRSRSAKGANGRTAMPGPTLSELGPSDLQERPGVS